MTDELEEANVEEVTDKLEKVGMVELNARGTAGVLSSPILSADVHIHNFQRIYFISKMI